MNSTEIRDKFLKYFESKGHSIVASSSLVPGNDPTLLFVNSGMVQFKDVFVGKEARPYKRATSSQRSVRAGGKHNDLENVGYTARHHTFFEMLGNFSFGDYFKQDAIKYAWELLTVVYGLPKDKLWVTVYQDDDEAYDIWAKEVGVPAGRIVRIGDNKGAKYASDNFWQMADTGPCGPCTEIFYDHGPDIAGGPPGSADADGDRYIEIWNLVFMQFDRQANGDMPRLPKPCVDTGMGLERIAAVLQHVHSNYEIDLFQALIKAAARETHSTDLTNNSLKVIADHIRACAFLIVDGVIPGSEWRSFVLRRIVRRAIRHGYKLGQKTPFFHKLIPDLVAQMGVAYPELKQNAVRVTEVLRLEEERFYETLANGMEILDLALDFEQVKRLEPNLRLEGLVTRSNDLKFHSLLGENNVLQRAVLVVDELPTESVAHRIAKSLEDYEKVDFVIRDWTGLVLPGNAAFKLHDTYGFPLDLTADVCRERGIAVDEVGFDKAMAQQREQARAAGKFKMAAGLEYSGAKTHFKGYDDLSLARSHITGLYVDGVAVKEARAGQDAVVVLDETPFYAESGGQVGDRGEIASSNVRFVVGDTQKIMADVFGHHGHVEFGLLKVGDAVTATVDSAQRARTIRNHSATHLMHKALREVLGDHVQQKGSLVDADKTRFDFVHNAPMNDEQIRQVEAIVNAEILANAATQARVMPMERAQKSGAMMLFGEKYGDEVRVLDIGSSREFCGGTHVVRTGDIGFFKIISEGGVAAGVRRVEAVTGSNALAYVQNLSEELNEVSFELGFQSASGELMVQKVRSLQEHARALEKELAKLKSKVASSQGDDLASQALDVKGVKLLVAAMEGADGKTLRETLDKLKDKLKSAVILLGAADGAKVSLVAGVTADLTGKIKAGELVNFVAQQVGGKGGGRPDMAQAGGTEPAKLPAALASVQAWVAERA